MPRPTRTNAAAAGAGAAMGALIGGPLGAGIGGLLGGVLGSSKLSLKESMQQVLQERGLSFVSVERLSRSRARLLFTDASQGYWTVEVAASSPTDASDEAVDDALFDLTVAKLDEWRKAHGSTT